MAQGILQRLFGRRQTKKAVLILGSGRSGTSVLTKCINLMGISLGTDNLLAPSKRINPKGYFENKDIIKIHKSLGGKLRYRPSYEGYYDRPKIKGDRDALTTYLQNYFETETYLAVKDPRMNDYIELWQVVLAEIKVEPAEIILLRNPMDVVSSNERAWHRNNTLALRQWQVRTLLSLCDTDPDHRMLLTYEDLFNAPLSSLHRVADNLGLPWPADEATLQAQINDFIDPSLQKSDSGEALSDFEARTDVDPDVKALYLLGRQATNDDQFFASDEFDQKIHGLVDDYLAKYGALYRDFNPKINSRVFYVLGTVPAEVDRVTALLTQAGVQMSDEQNAGHQTATAIEQQLTRGTVDLATYPRDFALVEQKEQLNNYLRRNAKKQALWGVGDVAYSAIVEMLMTVSTELGVVSAPIVIANDYAAMTAASAQQTAIQQLFRTISALQGQPYLLLMATDLDRPTTAEKVTDWVNATHTTTDQPREPALKLATPLDWPTLAVELTSLCQQATVSETKQAVLTSFIKTNYQQIIK
ncbi:hypothetical protein RA086_05830 [Lactiplantibacillus sp. WILCCON 0030]|uniref:Sulfotransferase family protein n=1 Tax=Lactiplantibacillus brownii TaxID=3069269 RepID=A0ABU1A9V7_9LACO|nr:hypothetical protein [Lactiplantibacillus brownii]MDQ7937145.1 hypothetical protein [Lactiplantibacillus brownii]